jgi:histone H3/H4
MRFISFTLIFTLLVPSFVMAGDVTKSRTIEEFFKENTKLRVAQEAIEAYKVSLNQTSILVIKKAESLAQGENRTTILDRDIKKATDEVFRRSPITVAELMEKISLLSIIELTDLSKKVKAYADELLKKDNPLKK